MAFELAVEINSLPDPLIESWQNEFKRNGIVVEIWPKFDPSAWGGGHLPIKLIEYPVKYLFGMEPKVQISGFELDLSPGYAGFRSAMGRPMAELIMVCYGAATLACITNGVYHDPQTGDSYSGQDAVAQADREIMAYEPYIDERTRMQYEFTDWADFE